MTPMTPQFMDPPPISTSIQDTRWQPTVDALVARPGEWALIYSGPYGAANNLANHIRQGKGVWAGRLWERTTRKVAKDGPDLIQVYARYLPPADPDPDTAYKAALEDEETK